MRWPPYSVLDLSAKGMLPHDWAEQVRAAMAAPERTIVQSWTDIMPGDERFSILEGHAVRARFGWLWDLYHGPLRAFVTESFSKPVFAANRVSSSITLNILEGQTAGHDWHTDVTEITGVFYASDVTEGEGGELEFRDGERTATVRPAAGSFVCFPGSVSHRVAPVFSSKPRLTFPLLYYASTHDQPFASEHDCHEFTVQ